MSSALQDLPKKLDMVQQSINSSSEVDREKWKTLSSLLNQPSQTAMLGSVGNPASKTKMVIDRTPDMYF